MSTDLTVFKDKKVHIELVNGEPYFCVQDICRDAEIKDVESVLRRLRNTDMFIKHPGIIAMIDTWTETGIRKMAYVNEAGLYEIVVGSRKPKAKELHRQILMALPELRKQAVPSATDNALADAINNMTAFLKSIEARVSVLEGKPAEKSEATQTAIAVLPEVQPKSYEAQINQHVRQWVEEKKNNNPRVSYPAVWNQIYYEFKYTYPHDLKRIAINRGISGVKAAALINMLPELLSLVIHLTDRDFNGYFE